MKNLIKQILKEYAEEQEKVLVIPSLKIFNYDWNALQQFLKSRGNPKWKILGNLNLTDYSVESLGNLTSVVGYLDLGWTPIQSLGKLTSVGGYLDLYNTPIKSLGNLTSVGGDLTLGDTPLSKKYSVDEIRQMVNIEGNIYM